MSWSHISFIEFFNLAHLDLNFQVIHIILAFFTLLVSVSETYGILLTLLFFMISQKILNSIIFTLQSGSKKTALNTIYNSKNYSLLFHASYIRSL